MVFHWILSDSKSLQVSRTCLSILANLSNAIIFDGLGMSSNFQFFQSLTKPLGTVPSAPVITIITFIFHNLFILL